MEQKTKNILAVVGGFLIWKAYRLYSAFKRLQYGVSGISFKGIREGAVMLNVGLWIKNTTPVQFLIGNLNADVYFNDINIGRISYPINRYLYAEAENTFSVGVEIFSTEALQSVWGILEGLAGKGNNTLDNWICRIVGTIELSNKQIPINFTITADDVKQ